MSTTKRKPVELPPGHTLQNGRFRIIKSLGRGGYGITYLAEQVLVDRQVCIKEFYIDSLGHRGDDGCSFVPHNDEQAEVLAHYREKFLKEARTLARLEKHNNPNIVRVRSCFEENGTAYYAMEFVDGRSLADICNDNVTAGVQGAMSEADALCYIGDVANALKTIHSVKTLHLDVKPSNIMVRDGRAVLIDFGISKHYDNNGRPTTTSMIGVSPGFSPLEQYYSDGRLLTSATDIYALAATLYTLVVGDIPPVAADVKSGGLPLLYDRNLSQSTIEAICKSMSSDAEDRPQSVDEFLALLTPKPTPHPVQPSKPEPKPAPRVEPTPEQKPAPRVEPKPVATPKAPTPAPKKSSKVWLWIVLALLLVGCGIGGWLIYDQNQEKARIEAEQKAQEEATRIAEEKRIAEQKAEPRPTPRVEPEPAETPKTPKPEPPPVQTPKPEPTPVQTPKPEPKSAPRGEPEHVATQDAQPKQESTPQSEQQRIDNMVAQGLGRDGVYQVGDYYNRGGKQGVVFEVRNGGRNGKIVSLDEAVEKQWCTDRQYKKRIVTGANSETDGKANTDMIMRRSDSSEYPAFVWCRNKGNDWYLPAEDELLAISKANDKINNTLSECGGSKLDNFYWTSTEYSEYSRDDKFCAWFFSMTGGHPGLAGKRGVHNVRAVSAF